MNTNDITYVKNGEVLFEFSYLPNQQMIIPLKNQKVKLPCCEFPFRVSDVEYEYVEMDESFQGVIVTVTVN